MTHRVVRGLKWARPCPAPAFATAKRARGAKAAGLRYERALAKASGGIHGQWFQFEDVNGTGFCQPDVMIDLGNCILVLEAKLSWVPEGATQIWQLYKPVVEAALVKPVIGIVVTKHLTEDAPKACSDFAEALRFAKQPACTPLLHWLGTGALRPRISA